MSYLPSDIKNNLLLSRSNMPSHGYTNNFLSSLKQDKFPTKDSNSTAIKTDPKMFLSKNSLNETSNISNNGSNLSKITGNTYNMRIGKDSSAQINGGAMSHTPQNSNITPTSQNKQTKINIQAPAHLKESTHSNETSHTASTGLNSVYNGNSTTNPNITTTTPAKPQIAENYLITIETLQRKIEQLSSENKKLSDNISTKSTSVLNKSIDEKEQREKLHTILEEKDKIERTYKQKIDKLTDENSKLLEEISSKEHEIKHLEQKLNEKALTSDETAGNEQEISQLRRENQDLGARLKEKERKYEELEETYKQKLSQFKRELTIIKTQQQTHENADFPRKEREIISDLEKKLENLTVLYEEKRQEVNELKAKLLIFEKDRASNQKPLQFSFSNNQNFNESRLFSASPLQNSRVGSFVKCNLDDFEEKINNLLQENESLAKNLQESQIWREKFQELEGKLLKSDEKERFLGDSSKIHVENDELKRNLSEITSDNSKIKGKLLDLERRFANLERDYMEKLTKKEEELTQSFEKVLKDLEEQKEKNINKISKENHELKQQNDDLQKQIQRLSVKPANFDGISSKEEKVELKPLSQSSSPILIINEMMTPSGNSYNYKNPCKEEKNKAQKTFGGLPAISENQEENSNNSSGSSEKTHSLLRKPESLKKINSLTLNNSHNNSNNTNNNVNITNNNSQNIQISNTIQINSSNNTNDRGNPIKQSSITTNNQGNLPENRKNSSSSINSQLASQIKLGEINQTNKNKDVKSTYPLTKPRENNATNNSNNNSNTSFVKEKNDSKTDFYKSDGNSQSKTELRASNLINSMNPFKQNLANKAETAKDKKIIMFNLMENHKKLSSNEGLSGGFLGNYASNKY